MADTREPVQEEPLPPPRPSTLRTGLGDKPMNDLPPDDIGDAAPEPRLAAQLGQVGAEETYVGAWARSRADCSQETDAPPLAISAQRAESFGGLMGTTSGVAGGLAATDPKLVPYGAMTATFYTGLGCLMGPSVLFIATRAVMG